MIYIYGAARAVSLDALPNAGVFGGTLRTIGAAGIDLIFEEVTSATLDGTLGEGARGNEALLHNAVLAHQAVLNDLVAKLDLLPFRFGTVVETSDDASAMLAEREAAFGAALDQISGHLEWGLKITRQAVKKETPKPASGADYLRQLSAQKQSANDAQTDLSNMCRAVAEAVQGGAKAVQPMPLRSNDNSEVRILNLAYLLPRGGEGAMADKINETVDQFGDLPALIEISGPWPAFSFADAGGPEANDK